MAEQQRRIQGLGWVRDLPDPRDLMFSAPVNLLKALPATADLRPQCPPVYDQGQIGSCTANAIAAAVQFDRRKGNEAPDFVPSRLFIYYNERAMEGHVAFDAGAQIRDGIKSVAQQGVCPEDEWPYDATPAASDGGAFPPGSRAAEKPTAQCYTDATQHTAIAYHRVTQVLSQMKGCLAGGYPFVFGISVFQSFWGPDGKQAVVTPLPSANDQPVGGHAVLAVGYDDGKGQFVVRNSWGPDNADHGYFYMPYEYVMDHQLASDFWVVSTIKA
ncbi:MAG TPA: C1 family peptidase [Candidatus Angelobacter sp.]|jgi:C1A family cysteine protease|nr:C1 family peptidase [Candidatus Angelobacter sp.]